MKKCSLCKKRKPLDDFGSANHTKDGKRSHCRKCRSKREKKYRKSSVWYSKQCRHSYSNKMKKAKNNKEYDIRLWATIWKSRPKENPHRLVQQKFLDSRKAIPIDTLVDLAKEALNHFPYMQFAHKTKTRGYTASIDRIDSSKPYTKDNIKVLPFWLNSAKLDMSYEELSTLIKSVPIEVITSPKERTTHDKD